MRPFNIRQLDHIVLRVSDLQRSIDFYQDVLGCTVERHREDLGVVHMRAGASMIDLVDINGSIGRQGGASAERERRNVDHFCLRIDPFDENHLIAYFERHGHPSDDAVMRYGAEGTGLSLYFFDPDGNQVELKGPSVPE
ncbi:VOC family protein [Burkholderia sp. BCC1977]|uniref:VOC family protein n=1 Tax=Burkholderia sp. BCC1977 TaxID=2817440 RepID=UPI002ABDF6F7|nr:VOC family protein [Burkholderia sp. BCC1977]